ncbi:hypothetical protein AX14_013875, partial [Amanita brunnescens Koide BX004]
RVWNALTGAELKLPNGHTHHVYSVAFSPDSTHIVSSSAEKSLCLFCALSPDGTRIASGSSDKSVLVWVPVQWNPSTYGTSIVSGSGSSDKSTQTSTLSPVIQLFFESSPSPSSGHFASGLLERLYQYVSWSRSDPK